MAATGMHDEVDSEADGVGRWCRSMLFHSGEYRYPPKRMLHLAQ
jgi:hypothetical protein